MIVEAPTTSTGSVSAPQAACLPLTLYGSSRSPFTRKVVVAAVELGLDPQLKRIATEVPAKQLPPAFVAANPLAQLPTVVLADGTALHESSVIVTWLDLQFGAGHWLPKETSTWLAAQRRQALADGLLIKLTAWRRELGRVEAQRSPAALENFARTAARVLDAWNEQAQQWTAAFWDVGYLSIAVALSYADFRFAELSWRNGRPALASWYAHTAARPALVANPLCDHDTRWQVPHA